MCESGFRFSSILATWLDPMSALSHWALLIRSTRMAVLHVRRQQEGGCCLHSCWRASSSWVESLCNTICLGSPHVYQFWAAGGMLSIQHAEPLFLLMLYRTIYIHIYINIYIYIRLCAWCGLCCSGAPTLLGLLIKKTRFNVDDQCALLGSRHLHHAECIHQAFLVLKLVA